METLTLVLWLLVAVLLSALIDRFIPRVSLPLIQVVLGAMIAIFARSAVDIDLDPELFLVMFIAPLLYLEAKDADKGLLWRNRSPIFSLAIGLVVVTTLAIGFILNALVPAIPLAAAFALGAALGPTDAVAVTSLSKQVSLPERIWGVLKGELLLNDASGIVSFQFALAAAITGMFSIVNASLAFVVEFFGGLVFGLVIGYGANLLLRKIRDIGIESTTFHVLYEICIPFIVYLASASCHVSGIIAVVVAGLVNVIAPRTVSPAIAHMNIVSSSVWQVISFALNGIVFVMLGTQIPTSMFYTWQNPNISNLSLIFYILVVTLVLMGVRFLWCLGMEAVHCKYHEKREFSKADVRNAAILTFCGSKGTITLSILFTIPFYIQTGQPFPQRNLIIFIGCGVILCTMLIANFLVPVVSPKRVRKQTEIEQRFNYYEVLADVLRNVIEQLTAQQTPSNRRSTSTVIKAYQDRLANTKEANDIVQGSNVELRAQAFKWEQERTLIMINENLVPKDVGYDYLARLERLRSLTLHRNEGGVFRRYWIVLKLALNQLKNRLKSGLRGQAFVSERQEEMRKLQLDTARFAANILKNLVSDDNVQTEDASRLLLFYENRISMLKPTNTSITKSFKIADESDDILRLAYQMELEQIQKMYEQDRITRKEATRMRENVYMMQMDLENKL